MVTSVDKWDRRYREAGDEVPAPAAVLVDNAHLLPPAGRALDLACGLGGNARWLAERGLEVSAWDFSPVAIKRLATQADRQGLELDAKARDVCDQPPAPASFDVIVVAHFLERSLASHLVQALRPDGLLFYETFTRERVGEGGPGNPDFLLGPNELLGLFRPLHLLAYREEGRVGDTRRGFRDKAWLVAQKRCGDGR